LGDNFRAHVLFVSVVGLAMNVSDAPVHVRAVPLQTAYASPCISERVPVQFEIDVATPATQERLPSELCIVLDKSGSMAGVKARRSTAAVHNAIDALVENDILHLLTYSDTVDVVFTGGTRARANELHALVSEIQVGGATNIAAALECGREVLVNSGEGGGTKRIFLLSDGKPSTGCMSESGLRSLAQSTRQDGILIDTFGIGADIDEELMKGIATSGRGSYHFLRETIIRQIIEDSMASLFRTVGRNTVIHVQSLPPVGRLTAIHRPLDDTEFQVEDLRASVDQNASEEAADVGMLSSGRGTVWIGDLISGGRKQSLIEAVLSLPESMDEVLSYDMLSYELVYECTRTRREIRMAGSVTVSVGNDGSRVPRVFVADGM
jgi:Mg-chelatase subunit ChlD